VVMRRNSWMPGPGLGDREALVVENPHAIALRLGARRRVVV
jgi:hypothetical protein